jgi:hypothetical protein
VSDSPVDTEQTESCDSASKKKLTRPRQNGDIVAVSFVSREDLLSGKNKTLRSHFISNIT